MGEEIQYQLKIYPYPPVGAEGVIITRVTEQGLESFKRQFTDPKNHIIILETVMPTKFMDDEEIIGKDQELYLKHDNVLGFYVTPINATVEARKIREAREEAEREEEESAKDMKDVANEVTESKE